MMDGWIDVLMITYNRAEYVRRSLPSLLEGCDERTRVWLWHNGDHSPTLEVVRELADHPRVAAFHHSAENVRLTAPTNWLWENATGQYVSKVDDDCLLEAGWARRLAEAHDANPSYGAIAASRLRDDDLVPGLIAAKTRVDRGGCRLLHNHWVQGSGYLVKARWIKDVGPLKEGQTFTQYCIELARRGAINGWYLPLIREEHMDDPRSPYTLLRTDADLATFGPLSARQNGVRTLVDWEDQLRRSALQLQQASLDLRRYHGWRRVALGARRFSRRALSGKAW